MLRHRHGRSLDQLWLGCFSPCRLCISPLRNPLGKAPKRPSSLVAHPHGSFSQTSLSFLIRHRFRFLKVPFPRPTSWAYFQATTTCSAAHLTLSSPSQRPALHFSHLHIALQLLLHMTPYLHLCIFASLHLCCSDSFIFGSTPPSD
jgi:hypothetical protein